MTKQRADFSALSKSVQKKINSDQVLNALKKMKDIQGDAADKLSTEMMIDRRISEIISENKEN